MLGPWQGWLNRRFRLTMVLLSESLNEWILGV